ncbi:phage tail protein [Actinotalea sp. M2MS4P-6]|uniref:phage tail protein n=1 Tax=Actinotalea sp. M2MS4P-6 TaxID=2983762 RepID=UPI0021E362BD|nr:phage tail protein [Actinotalea sp. M2MS4P-6]MCV2395210.1 phage tail protein [Actinotalea sp. M2MS4P-6]
MSEGLFTVDPMIAQNFFLEIDGEVMTALMSVSGLDVEVSVATIQQVGKDGKQQLIKTLGQTTQAGDLTLTRVAPNTMGDDKLWKWFNDVRNKGMTAADRASARKNGSIVVYDAAHTEVARFNFFNAWPSKISTDQLSVDSSDAIKESITLVLERLERVK